jgi:hypothetical protein
MQSGQKLPYKETQLKRVFAKEINVLNQSIIEIEIIINPSTGKLKSINAIKFSFQK